MKNVTRSEILDTAKEYVTKDRAAQHGDMESNLTMIANLWSVFLETKIEPHQVGVCMTLLKIARIKSTPENADHWEDSCGYMACGGELIAKKPSSGLSEPTYTVVPLGQNSADPVGYVAPDMSDNKIKRVIKYLTDIRDVAAISEETDWYAMMAQNALDKLKDSTA